MENLKPKFILARKIGMTQVFKDDKTVPVTVLEVLPAEIVRIKEKDKDGYKAVVLKVYTRTTYGQDTDIIRTEHGQETDETDKNKMSDRSVLSPNKSVSPEESVLSSKKSVLIKEFRLEGESPFQVGEKIDASIFKVGELVNVRAQRKAKGFAGVVKRHGFAGGPRTHGQKDRERAPGSIGQRWPQRVRKGLRMAGRIAPIYVTVKNLEIIDIIPEKNLILVKGSVPGPNKRLVEIRSAFLTNRGKIYLTKEITKKLRSLEAIKL